MSAEVELAKQRLASARSIAVLTGAGVSAESGVPTFRGAGGLWKNFRAEELATPEAFDRDPKLVWEWYDWRRGIIADIKPNPGHFAIAKMEKHFHDFLLITQNVDGLHRIAGNTRIAELHGNIWYMRCVKEGRVHEDHDVPLKEIPPKCSCGALLRPHIVWFGESLESSVYNEAVDACRRCEVLIVAGTSAVVQPAASLAGMAKDSGAFVVEINPEVTPITDMVDISLRGLSGEILPLLVRC
jgi:NAD-dependent deacetylase